MADLEKKVLGILRGRIGGTVFKIRNGKNYAASMPSQYTASQAPHEVDKRNRFRVNSKFAKAIKESELLRSIWYKEKAPAANAYNKICKVNFKLCGTDRPSENNIITPGGFILQVRNVQYLPDRIEAVIEPFDLIRNEKKIVFIMIASFYEPKLKKNNYFELLRMQSDETEGLKLTFYFDQAEKKIAKAYKSRTVFLAAVTQDENENIVRWSKTYAEDL